MTLYVNDRTRNHDYSLYEEQPDGSWAWVKYPFMCDDCKTKPARYGCVESPGQWLRCPGCHVKAA